MKVCHSKSFLNPHFHAKSQTVRTPLNAIVNYLEIALESPLDADTRENLARSHSASKSLIYVINDLLDLTRTEAGQDLIKDEVFDLRQVIFEATEMFKMDLGRKGLSFEVIEYPGLPPLVKGDATRLRQVVSNVTANAVKHTTKGGLKIEVWTGNTQDGTCEIEIAVEDTGEGISPGKLDTLFGELEQIHTEDDPDLTGAQQESASFNALSKIPGQKMLGLGLAVVARSIRNMKGQLRLKSEEGKGSRFTLCLPLKLPPNQATDESKNSLESMPTNPVPPPSTLGEVTLIQTPGKPLSRPPSSSGQLGSATAQIDRLVDAISSPTSTGTPSTATEYFSARPSSASMMPCSLPGLKLPARSCLIGGQTSNTPISERPNPVPGQEIASGSVAPIRPVNLNYDGIPVPSGAAVPLPPPVRPEGQIPVTYQDNVKFNILVAEDDPINSRIIKKRLEKMGHTVTLTVNGEECYEIFMNDYLEYDAILMDMQVGLAIAIVPIREGFNINDPTS